LKRLLALLGALLLASCGGGAGGDSGCSGSCTGPDSKLAVADVERILAQAIHEAQARGAHATIAVVDRVGNVLAVYRMAGADVGITVDSGRGVTGGLEQISVIPDSLAAIAKAITGAYLSSEGNAFTTRTASQIVQDHFNPQEHDQPGGPLFGVQFSQLPCSDLNTRFAGGAAGAGPQRSPLGLSADAGGLPLYRGGALVGGIGVIADGTYSADLNIRDRDQDVDEIIALAATRGFEAPADRRADRITAGGLSLRFIDAEPGDLRGDPATVPAFATLNVPAVGALIAVPEYSAGPIRAGTDFGQPESGIRPAGPAFAGLDAFVLVDNANAERFAPRDATDAAVTGAAALKANEVTELLRNALGIANRARAQIRRPVGSPARVTMSVVDTHGAILGIARTRDAPIFGIDVSLQKARSVAFFSGTAAAADLSATPDTKYLGNDETVVFADYVTAYRSFVGNPTGLADGAVAFSDRAIGNLARPSFPDGIDGSANGPLSKPFARWSPFSTGLQLDLVNSAILTHVVHVLGGGPDIGVGACTGMPATPSTPSRLANGLQIFAGAVPVYRGGTLIGALGISGDGIDQDDMVSFLGTHNAGLALGGALGNAPAAIRSDTLQIGDTRLRYVQCPQAPFNGSDEQNVCQGK